MQTRVPEDAESSRRRLERLGRFAELLDESIRIPGIGYRIGYDALIGLIPGIGDVVGLMMSTYVVVEAARFRIPRSTLMRMMTNIGMEALIGAIPLLGDIFDATYKANLRNLRLLHRRLDERSSPAKEDKRYFITLLLIPVLLGILILAVLVLVISALV